ncbi:hypothetical protein [Curtobacterium sp. 9128]|uniref:hypothetical protein n=1 Tax=Curtobacterium sp. 9128 TaxID=1793722 RepID=UPI00119D5C37|nr:hypothetical protein [Curtobacterium sp. 9128]
MTKRTLTMTTGIVVATALLCGPVAATAASAAAPSGANSIQVQPLAGWTTRDWQEVAERARAAGDAEGAVAALAASEHVASTATGDPVHRNIWTTIAKKAVVAALRYGTNKLPAAIRPYVNKIINVVEEIDQFQQGAVVLALTKVGIPYDVAVTTAQWIVVFVGL